jgi:hypothetical protein
MQSTPTLLKKWASLVIFTIMNNARFIVEVHILIEPYKVEPYTMPFKVHSIYETQHNHV